MLELAYVYATCHFDPIRHLKCQATVLKAGCCFIWQDVVSNGSAKYIKRNTVWKIDQPILSGFDMFDVLILNVAFNTLAYLSNFVFVITLYVLNLSNFLFFLKKFILKLFHT